MAAEDSTFRGAMRLLAGGVTIVATAWQGQRSGLTATAVCSLALSPPRILASVNRRGQSYDLIAQSRVMSVNLLAREHEALAHRFAGREGAHEDRFSLGQWCEGVTGAPVLADALAALDCRVAEIVPIDSHAIFIGVVEDVVFGPRRAPLLHYDGDFTTLESMFPEIAP
jgi:flavin reductase (DIM6/NTAB) family NADH-FMN oxidoreductase RutF